MERLLKKIYEGAVKDEPEAVGMEKAVSGYVVELLKPYERLDDKGREEIKDMLFSVALMAEQEGFELGVRTVLKLLAGLSSA